MIKITTELVQALFDYKDGALYWRQSPSRNTSAGMRAGCHQGVFCEGTRYTAQIQVNGKRKRLGPYPTIEEAAAARRQAESLLFSTELLSC
jgi:hypothetical protein